MSNNREKQNPLVSIVTVCLNSEKYIKETIESVINQTYKNIEYIIIDGGSKDNTLKIIDGYRRSISILRSEPDRGIYDAMNKGIKLSRGELIGLLNSDDWYEIDTVRSIVQQYRGNENIDIIHGNMRVWTINGEPLGIVAPKKFFGATTPFKHPTCFITRKMYEKIGYYRVDLQIAADYDFMLRALRHCAKLYYLPSVLTNFRKGGYTLQCSPYIRTMEKIKCMYDNRLGIIMIIRAVLQMLRIYVSRGIRKILF